MSTLGLGIETSCDETSVALVRDGQEILSNVVQTQIDLHKIYGGVVPEIACRAHIETLLPVLKQALQEAKLTLEQVDYIAVTHSPGLIGALLVGVSLAKSLALAAKRPLIGIDHIHAHIYANKLAEPTLRYPCISLIVSGGHTSLYISHSEIRHELLGSTTDDAAGEAFDKVGKILGLPFPGGPAIEKAAQNGNCEAISFPRTYLEKDSFDFSFSGIKTAVLYHVHGQNARHPRMLTPQEVAHISASFQEAMVDMLVEKTLNAVRQYSIPRVAVGGGVACNMRLREKLQSHAQRDGVKVNFPPKKLCTDNAAMVAGLGYHLFRQGAVSDMTLDTVPTRRV